MNREKSDWKTETEAWRGRRMKWNRLCSIFALLIAFCLSGCAKKDTAARCFETKADFAGIDAATITGSAIDALVDESIEGIT